MSGAPADTPTVHSSQAEVWYLKQITFGDRRCSIITQNFNGPCSFIAICNILILRGQIEILPPDRATASYEFLSQLVGEYLLTCSADMDISAALSALPYTQKGMDLNPLFTGPTLFRPGGKGGELDLFKHAGIDLVHGWLVDPHSPEAPAVTKVEDYDSAVDLVATADHITKGQLLSTDPTVGPSSPTSPLDAEDRTKVEDAILVRHFLDGSWSQLTYTGLFELSRIIKAGILVALFRSSHLSVVYKPLGRDNALYSLITDHAFLHEPTVVWQRMDDVEGVSTSYVDADFNPANPAGGDIMGQTAEQALMAAEYLADPQAQADKQLAIQLQQEEEHEYRELRAQHDRRLQEQHEFEERKKEKKRLKKEKSCIIM